MKNIHIIPTDKPSRLHLGNSGLVLCESVLSKYTINGQHIHITNDEEIKEDTKPCWCLATKDNSVNYYQGALPLHNYIGYKKIILTTDVDLIADGVQAIDDKFLEWFVQNPTCEKVEVFKERHHGVEFINDYPKGFFDYKIIIPQEEPKQETLEEACLFCEGRGQVVSSTTISGFKTCDCINIPQEEPKQETLEEAAEKNAKKVGSYAGYQDFIAGAKYQAERMYSEEEIMKLVDGAFHMYASSHRHDAKEWLVEQFKKK
jgi:hypothetical protein